MAYELEQTAKYPGGLVDSEFREIRTARNDTGALIPFGIVVGLLADSTCRPWTTGDYVFGISAFEQKVGDGYGDNEECGIARKATIYTLVGGAASVAVGDTAYVLDGGTVTNDDGSGANPVVGVFLGVGQPDEYVAVQINLP